MKKLSLNIKQRKKASTLLVLASTEIEAIDVLLNNNLFREAVVHLYFASFYISHALFCHKLPSRPSHNNVENQLHHVYGRKKTFPRRYVKLHSMLHKLRTEIDYRSSHSPEPSKLKIFFKQITAFYKFAYKVIPEIQNDDILQDILDNNQDKIKDFSIDIYCPKTYFHHTRITVWFPPFYLKIFRTTNVVSHTKIFLKKLKIKNSQNYVAGLNSKLDQYSDRHLLMFDIDSIDAEVEATLKKIGGLLLKTGRGFHFIGKNVIEGGKEWTTTLKKTLRDPVLKQRIDKKHIAISLQRGYSTLRITGSPSKPIIPQFFKEF